MGWYHAARSIPPLEVSAVAYAHTISSPQRGPDGTVVYVVTETDVQASSEWGPINLPPVAFLLSFACARASGTAAGQIDPELGRAASWTAHNPNHLLSSDWGDVTPDVYFAVQSQVALAIRGGALYGRTKPDANGDAFTTTLVLKVS